MPTVEIKVEEVRSGMWLGSPMVAPLNKQANGTKREGVNDSPTSLDWGPFNNGCNSSTHIHTSTMSSDDDGKPSKVPRTRIARACENCRARRKKCQPPYPCQACRDAGLPDCLVRDKPRPLR